MRKYQQIWEQLKKLDRLEVTDIARKDHDKVINALRKESAKDVGFRFRCVEKDMSYQLGIAQIDDLLILRLDWKQTVPPAFVITPEKLAKRKEWWTPYVRKDAPPIKDKDR